MIRTFETHEYQLVRSEVEQGFRNIQLIDHIDGFDCNYKNRILNTVQEFPLTVWTQTIFNEKVKASYPTLNFKFDLNLSKTSHHVLDMLSYGARVPTDKNFKNFICSFNGSDRPDRLLLTAALYKLGWVNLDYFSKNFSYNLENLTTVIQDYSNDPYYVELLADQSAGEFYNLIHGFNYVSWEHQNNVETLYTKINSSFIQLVGETYAASYHPFTSEKFIQPMVCKSLWIAYSQPGYHAYLEKYYGFKLHHRLFDYGFDLIENPVERLVRLTEVLKPYANLSSEEWYQLYQDELDIIEYNYDWYYSRKYLSHLSQFAGQ